MVHLFHKIRIDDGSTLFLIHFSKSLEFLPYEKNQPDNLLFLSAAPLLAQPAFNVEHIKSTMEKATFWQLEHPKHKDYDWTNGAFYAGVFAAYKTTQNEDIFQALLDRGQRVDWRPGLRLTHADDHAICQTYDIKHTFPLAESSHPFAVVPIVEKVAGFVAFLHSYAEA